MKAGKILLVCLGLVGLAQGLMAVTATPTPKTVLGGDGAAQTRRRTDNSERIVASYLTDKDGNPSPTLTQTLTSTPITNTVTNTPSNTPQIIQTNTLTQTLTPNGSGTYTNTSTNTPNTVITQTFTSTLTANGSGTYTPSSTNTPNRVEQANSVNNQTFTPTPTIVFGGGVPTLATTPAIVASSAAVAGYSSCYRISGPVTNSGVVYWGTSPDGTKTPTAYNAVGVGQPSQEIRESSGSKILAYGAAGDKIGVAEQGNFCPTCPCK